jgi:hypothetical protein
MVVTDMPLDRLAAAMAGLIAGLLMESPAYLQRALRRPLRQDVFAEGGRLLGVTHYRPGGRVDIPRWASVLRGAPGAAVPGPAPGPG